MKIPARNAPSRTHRSVSARALIMAIAFCSLVCNVHGQEPPGWGSEPHDWLQYWPFTDTSRWSNSLGYAPVTATNLDSNLLGSWSTLVVDTNAPAWLQFNVHEGNGSTNLTVDQGSLMFWFAPLSWSSTNSGGAGPGVSARFIEVGSYTEDASYGWWSLYTDLAGTNLYFSAQGDDGSQTNYLSAPIAWTSNGWHHIALTYSSTNSSLYLDGDLVTNGLPVTIWPNSNVLAGGFFIGSDNAGTAQMHGMMDDLYTYGFVIDSNLVRRTFIYNSIYYYLNPMNAANISSAPITNYSEPTLSAITGPGFLQWLGAVTNCVTSGSVWFTNMSATVVTNGTMNFSFTIQGGSDGAFYDVFATATLTGSGYGWAWMGQGYHCNTYMLTNLPISSAFFILGTAQDSDFDGLTDAYEKLVSHSDPFTPNTSGDGLSDLYKVLHGLPVSSMAAVPSLGSITLPCCPIP